MLSSQKSVRHLAAVSLSDTHATTMLILLALCCLTHTHSQYTHTLWSCKERELRACKGWQTAHRKWSLHRASLILFKLLLLDVIFSIMTASLHKITLITRPHSKQTDNLTPYINWNDFIDLKMIVLLPLRERTPWHTTRQKQRNL